MLFDLGVVLASLLLEQLIDPVLNGELLSLPCLVPLCTRDAAHALLLHREQLLAEEQRGRVLLQRDGRLRVVFCRLGIQVYWGADSVSSIVSALPTEGRLSFDFSRRLCTQSQCIELHE